MADDSPTLDDVFGRLSDLDDDILGDNLEDEDLESWQQVSSNGNHGDGSHLSQDEPSVQQSESGMVMSPPGEVERSAVDTEPRGKRLVRDWDLNHFQPDPESQFWLPHLGRARQQFLPKQPWETSPVARVFDAPFLQPPKYHRWGMADAVMGVTVDAPSASTTGVATSPPEFIVRRLKFASLSRDEDMVRRKCLQKLRSLILIDPPATQLGSSLLSAAGTLANEDEVAQSFKDSFASKSTATLEKRLAALWPYAKWSLSTQRTPLHMDEPKIYEYLNMLRSEGCSASAPSSFLEAVGFLHNIVEVKSLVGAPSFSSRCKGLAKDHPKTRSKRKQAPPLTVEMVSALETYVGTHFRSHKAVIAGHVLFCIYSCARWADTIRLTEITEFHKGRISIVETATEHHKSALTDEAKSLFLPYLCLGAGLVEGHPWSKAWLAARQIHKVGRPHTWASIASWSDRNNKFTTTGMSSTEASLWLREVLEECGFTPEVASTVSSHSLKSTLLSWSAKSGKFTDPQRRQMGHHMDAQDRSMLVYSRDAYAPIAVAVRLMLDDILEGRFNPDLPRVDRIAKAVELAADGSSSGESSSTDDGEDGEHSPSTKLPGFASDVNERHPDIPYVPATFVMVHKLSGVMHVSSSESTFACGRKITSSFINWNSGSFESVDTNICAQCRAKAALHFQDDGSEQYEPTSEELSD